MNKKFFLKLYFFITLIISIPFLMTILFLYNAGELSSVDDIVERQMRSDVLYGSALNQNTFHYKLKLVEKIKPEIIALGSSRVMPFRKELFNVPFINAGGAVNCISEAETFVDLMLKTHKPKVILFALDDWWFNDASTFSEWENPKIDYSQTITNTKLLFLLKQLYAKNISFNDYVDISLNFNQNYPSKILSSNLLGISAIKKQTGFRSDGSYFYGNIITSKNEEDYKFKDTLRRISNGVDRFEYSNKLSQKKWNRLESLLKRLESEGVEVIVFLPPYSKTAYHEIFRLQDKYVHVSEISEKIKDTDIQDFRNPETLGLTDCDFIDGFHGSELAYMKLLSKINNKKVQSMIHHDTIEMYGRNDYRTNICLPIGFTAKYKEKDLLDMGCRRNREIGSR